MEYSPDDHPEERLLGVPKPLVQLYNKKPVPVLKLLLVIMEGGNPNDSSLAGGYGLELIHGRGNGLICVTNLKKASYDKVDKDWSMTPRQHWIKVLHANMKDKKLE